MKKLIIIISLFAVISGTSNAKGHTRIWSLTTKDVVLDTIKELKYHCQKVETCDSAKCISAQVSLIKKYPVSSYILLYKKPQYGWILEKHPNSETISAYKIKRITVLQGKIELAGAKYYDKKYAVIIE